MAANGTGESAKPLLVRAFPFYYGWVVLLVGAVGMIMTSPGQTYTVSIFIEHFISDLGISRSLVSSLYTVGTLIGGFLLPWMGRLVDRRGVRRTMTAVAVLFALACIFMGTVRGAVMLAIGFALIRWLGQGSLWLVSANAINRWWVNRRGTVMGVAGVLAAILGLGGYPWAVDRLIPVVGWRWTYAILGLATLGILVPMAWWLLRDRPEDVGLLPDGVASPRGAGRRELTEENWPLSEAIRTPAFWILSLGSASIAMLTTGLLFHIVSIFADHALSPSAAAAAFAPIAVATAVLTLLGGTLIDRVPPKFMMALALGLQAAALVLARSLHGPALAMVFGVALGATQGLSRSVSGVVWAKYFGRCHLGSIAGLSQTIGVLGAALGPLPLGIARDVLGSYDAALLTCSVLPVLLGMAALFVPRPRRRTQTAGSAVAD